MKSIRELYRIGSGPSSSHTMAIEAACNYIKNNYPNSKYNVTLFGSLALTGKGHFTDKIIRSVLGEDTVVYFNIDEIKEHPNTFVIDNSIEKYEFVSTGGGEVTLNNVPINSKDIVYPFRGFTEIKEYAIKNNLSLEEVVYNFEDKDIKDYLFEVWSTMKDAIKRGLNAKGVLPGGLNVKRKAKDIFEYSKLEKNKKKLIAYAYAVSEENASMGKIVTAPTCGSCGVIPAVLYYYKEENDVSDEKLVNSLAVASLIGNTIKERATLSGAVAGCQAEIGSACSMASAALAYLRGLNLDEIEASAEIAMEHHLGLTCDPIDGLVQIPCIERNAVAALRAYDASIMASLPIYPEKLTFDNVVDTMMSTGIDIDSDYKETAMAGLAKINIKR